MTEQKNSTLENYSTQKNGRAERDMHTDDYGNVEGHGGLEGGVAAWRENITKSGPDMPVENRLDGKGIVPGEDVLLGTYNSRYAYDANCAYFAIFSRQFNLETGAVDTGRQSCADGLDRVGNNLKTDW